MHDTFKLTSVGQIEVGARFYYLRKSAIDKYQRDGEGNYRVLIGRDPGPSLIETVCAIALAGIGSCLLGSGNGRRVHRAF
jgi:hypothetical protein